MKILHASCTNEVKHSPQYIYSRLVLAGLSLGIPRHVVISVYGHALSLCLEYLDTDVNAVVSIELSDTERVLNIVRSVLCSKPLCRMSPLALETLAILIVKVCCCASNYADIDDAW